MQVSTLAADVPRPNIHDLIDCRTYALPTIEESLATPLSDDLLFDWTVYAEKTPPTVNVKHLAWDLRRRCGSERGRNLFWGLVEEWGDLDSFDQVWAACDRPECESDQHILHELASIHNRGELLDLILPDDGESVRNELDALADCFDTLNFKLSKEAFEPYRVTRGTLFNPIRNWFTRLEQQQFARDLKTGKIPMPAAPLPLPFNATSGAISLMSRGESLPADSEDSLALDFASLHADDLRYVEEWGRWMHWSGQAWTPDKTSSAYNLIREHLRKFAGGLAYQDARKVATAKTVAAVERMARTDRRIVTTGDIWDADTMLLNTPGGVVDLQTGRVRTAQPSDHMTKLTAVAPGGDCPTWRAFLAKSLAGDADLIAFIQRVLGYALTGDTREHALFFMYGQGGNGKGVLLNTVAGIMGDYQKTAPVETFIDSPHDRHPTDLASLRGARLVTASETEKGRRWAEAKIKMLTGGDRIAARFMRQDFFEFVPQFKLVIAGNHKPSLRSVDAAMRRRMHLIPFTVNIPEGERDTSLPERLRAEWGGILAWLIEGCLAWQRDGLQPPAAVRAATDEYLASEDVLGSWLDERCDLASGNWASRQELFGSWTRWAEGSREFVGTQKQFLDTMRNHQFEEGKREGVRGFRGVRLKPPPLPPLPR